MLKEIYIDLNDELSILKAEIKQRNLYDEGYRLISEDIGFLTAKLIYKKDKNG